MLDIKILRTEPERVKAALKRRNSDIDVDAIIKLDEERRSVLFKVEQLDLSLFSFSTHFILHSAERSVLFQDTDHVLLQ